LMMASKFDLPAEFFQLIDQTSFDELDGTVIDTCFPLASTINRALNAYHDFATKILTRKGILRSVRAGKNGAESLLGNMNTHCCCLWLCEEAWTCHARYIEHAI
jgi:hypothetical protein